MEHSQITELLAEFWNITGEVFQLPGERDLNFKISSDRDYVFKVYEESSDSAALLAIQDRVLVTLSKKFPAQIPTPIPSKSGETTIHHGGRLLRLLSYIPGELWAESGNIVDENLLDLGRDRKSVV